jgi:hypothetical protein
MNKFLRSISLLLLLASSTVPLASRASTFSDLWYDPQESGWGMNVVQQGEIVFITLFVYGRDGSPGWYVAPDAHLVSIAEAGGGLPRFAGTLYRTRGPWFGQPFDASSVNVTPAGDISIEALSIDRILLKYQVDGTSVHREVVRQTWRAPAIGPFYLGVFNLKQIHPGQGLFDVLDLEAETAFFVDGPMGWLIANDNLGRRCEYKGAYVQAGKLGSLVGNYTCGAGQDARAPTAGTFEMTQIEATANGITAALHTSSPSLEQSGRFAGVRH